MKTLVKFLVFGVIIAVSMLCVNSNANAKENPLNDLFNEIYAGIKPSPGKIYSALKYVKEMGSVAKILESSPVLVKWVEEDPGLKLEYQKLITKKFVAKQAISFFFDVAVEAMEKKGVLGKDRLAKDLVLLWGHSTLNALTGPDPISAGIDATCIVVESWDETKTIIASLPPDAEMDPSLRDMYYVVVEAEKLKKEGHIFASTKLQIGAIAMAVQDQIKVTLSQINPTTKGNTSTPPADASKLSQHIVGNVTNLDNEAPRLVKTDIAVSRGATSKLSLSYTFNEPVSNSRVGIVHTSGFCGPAGCTGTWSDFKWSSDRKTAVTTFTPSGGSYVSPPGSIVTWSTTSSTFKDLSGNYAPAESGSFTLK